jgi:hypothetical protein
MKALWAATFLFRLAGVPVGTVSLEWEQAAGRYTYHSRHLFARGEDASRVERSETYALEANGARKDGRRPESLWLARRPPKEGCVAIFEELGARLGEGCVERLEADQVEGTVFGQPYAARYSQDGTLEELGLGRARFTRLTAATPLPPAADPFAAGWPLPEGRAWRIEPPVAAERLQLPPWRESEAWALAARVNASFVEKRPSPADFDAESSLEVGSCLGHVRRFRKWASEAGHPSAVVYGLLVDKGRAYPHAWIRIGLAGGGTLDLDPTSLDQVKSETHIPLAASTVAEPPPSVGELWLDLLAGRRRLVAIP